MKDAEDLNILFKNLPDAAILTDSKGNILQCNKATEKLTGYSRKKLLSMSEKDIYAERTVKNASKKSIPLETEILKKNSRRVPVCITESSFRFERKYCKLKLLRVISDSNLLNQSDRTSALRYKALYDSSRDAIMILEPPTWRFTAGNDATIKMFRAKDEKEFTALAPWQFSPPKQPDGKPSRDKAKAMIMKALKEGSNFFEWTHRRINGADFPASVLLTRVDLGKGNVFLQATVRDITDRKNVEGKLELQRQQMLSIFDSIDEVIYVTDPNTYEILYANTKIKKAFGKKLVGKTCYKALQGKNSPCDFCTNDIIFKKGKKYEPYRWEFHNPIIDRTYAITDRVIKWPDGRDVRFELAVDVTNIKKVQDELEKRNDELERFNKLAIGREMRMIELKKEIERLKKEIERLKKD